jgi:glycosyltransferase involved in cell wall biosynthesis
MSMSQPTLAICIPAYNAARFLPRLLQSVDRQTQPFDEVLVYDDCSTDETGNVARSFGADVIRGDVNVGCSAAKNRLFQASHCDWIHFHDADDELLPKFTSLARRWMASPAVPDVVLFDYEYRENDSGELIGRSSFSDRELRNDPVRYAILNQINPFCGVYRRSDLVRAGGYDVDAKVLYNEDVAFHCKLALAGLTFGAEKEVSIINYRVNGSMSGANQVRCLKAHYEVMRKMAAAVGGRYPEEIAIRLWAAAQGLAASLEWSAADDALALARQLFPHVPRGQSPAFSQFCRLAGPRLAFRIRERGIRISKPHLR